MVRHRPHGFGIPEGKAAGASGAIFVFCGGDGSRPKGLVRKTNGSNPPARVHANVGHAGCRSWMLERIRCSGQPID